MMHFKKNTGTHLGAIVSVVVFLFFGFLGQATCADIGPLLPDDLQISTGTGIGEKAAVAFDGNRYLVVWTQYNAAPYHADIYGRFLTRAGACDGDPFLISTTYRNNNQNYPAVAFNGEKYLVVWWSNTDPGYNTILGKTIGVDGSLGAENLICDRENANNPQVASDGTNFLVVWTDNRNYGIAGNYNDIYGQRVDGSGTLLGANFPISPLPRYQAFAAIGYGGGRYLVTWFDSPDSNYTGSDIDLYAALVDSAGTVTSQFPISTAPGQQAFWNPNGISFDGTNFLVVWQDQRSGHGEIYGNRVTPAGALLDGDAATGGFLIATGDNAGSGSPKGPQAVFDGANWLVAWGAGIRGARVSPAGEVLDPAGIRLYKTKSDSWFPGLAYGGNGNFLLTWYCSDSNWTKYAQLIGPLAVNHMPTASAGPDLTIYTDEVSGRTIPGNATDQDGDTLQYRWLKGATVLLDWTAVQSGACPLSLDPAIFVAGTHTLTLEVKDTSQATASDTMVLTVVNRNHTPSAQAGDDVSIYSSQVSATTIQGKATDDDGDTLHYRWLEGGTELLTWTPAVGNVSCPLALAGKDLGIGSHTLTLEVTDGQVTASSSMNLNIANTPPSVTANGGGTYQTGQMVVLSGQAADFDGESITYTWLEGSTILGSGTIATASGGPPVALPDLNLANLNPGTHMITLQVNDGTNPAVTSSPITVVVVYTDTLAPTLAPTVTPSILWPPNHQMVAVTVMANASDNSGLPVTLEALVKSSEPILGTGDGDTAPDWTDPVVDQVNGIITLNLRAERAGGGSGRTYTIVIKATDAAGNFSTAEVQVIVPHDKKKK
jgi:hypothetical protein